jgi:imidazolonepropionase-like amidohydrolase
MTSDTVKSPSACVALVGGTLIDGTGSSPVDDATVVFFDGRISDAGPADTTEVPPGAETIDVAGMTVIPGLMDTHIHLKMGLDDPWKVKDLRVPVDLDMPLTLIGIKGLARAQLALGMGFTTLRDAGDIGHLGVSLRDSIASGLVEGPRILACGENFSATGGTTDFLPDWIVRRDVPPRVFDGVTELRRAVRTLAKNRVDWIKFIATGTLGPTALEQEYSDEEIAAIVDESHARGKPVAAHACFGKGANALARAGVDSIEHGCALDEETLALMLERDIFLVPTLSLFASIVRDGVELDLPARVIEAAKVKLDEHVASFQRALAAGVSLAAGSDIGSPACAHGRSARELSLMVEFGMSPLQAIRTATRESARLLRIDDLVGTLTAGRRADLVVVDGDPVADIRVLEDERRIALVVRDGRIVRDRRPDRVADRAVGRLGTSV